MAGAVTTDENQLPQVVDYFDGEKQYRKFLLFYEAGIRHIMAKLEILNSEFQYSNDRNPIENIKSRVKSMESILNKLKRKGLPMTFSAMANNIYDIAGVRVTCPFIQDVYQVARLLLTQKDVELLVIKDYIRDPKENGYRSLHLIVMVEIYFSNQAKKIPVEIQIRTIAMDFWASTEHQLRYKKDAAFTEEMHRQLKECADLMAEADQKMQKLAGEIRF